MPRSNRIAQGSGDLDGKSLTHDPVVTYSSRVSPLGLPMLTRIRQLHWIGAGSAFSVVILYCAAVLTPWGQNLDDVVFIERKEESAASITAFKNLLPSINVATIALCLIAVGIVATRRRIRRVGLVMAASFLGAVLTAETMKRILPRPELSSLETIIKGGGENSFPSGHTTIAVAAVMTLIVISAPRWRVRIVLLGGIFAAAIAVGVLAAGWHRPSDALGGIALALGWQCFAVAWLLTRNALGQEAFTPSLRVPALVASFVGITVIAITYFRGSSIFLEPSVASLFFPLTEGAIWIASIIAITLISSRA